MKVVKKDVYYCDFCKKKYFIKTACENHEEICWSNPANNKPCYSCTRLEKVNYTLYYDSYIGEQTREVSIFHCKKLDKYLHTHVVENKGNAFDLVDHPNEPMPKTCNDFEDKFINPANF